MRGWVERQRKKEIEEMEERESKIQKGGISTAKRYVSRERSIKEKCRHSRVRERGTKRKQESPFAINPAIAHGPNNCTGS